MTYKTTEGNERDLAIVEIHPYGDDTSILPYYLGSFLTFGSPERKADFQIKVIGSSPHSLDDFVNTFISQIAVKNVAKRPIGIGVVIDNSDDNYAKRVESVFREYATKNGLDFDYFSERWEESMDDDLQ